MSHTAWWGVGVLVLVLGIVLLAQDLPRLGFVLIMVGMVLGLAHVDGARRGQ
jgi:hypothetical protein